MLVFAVALAAQTPPAGLVAMSPPGGLISTAQFSVRVVVVDRCVVGQTGAACDGAASIKPLPVLRASRIEITF